MFLHRVPSPLRQLEFAEMISISNNVSVETHPLLSGPLKYSLTTAKDVEFAISPRL